MADSKKSIEEKEELIEGEEEEQLIESGERNENRMIEEKKNLPPLKESYIRLMADFDNYKKRIAREKAELIERGEEGLIVDLLEFLDEMNVYLMHIKGAEKEGVEQAFSKLLEVLKKHGLEVYNPVNKAFSPNIAEAVQKIEVDDKKKDELILQVIQMGYSFKGKILRYPKVVVGHYAKK